MPQQRPPRRPMPQDTAAARNARARERAIRAEEQRKMRYYRRKKRAETLAYAARIFFLAFLASVIVGILAVFLVKRDFSRAPEKFSYSLTVKKDEKTVSLKKGTTVRNNTLYVSLEDLADLIGFRLMGDAKIMNAVFPTFRTTSAFRSISTPTVPCTAKPCGCSARKAIFPVRAAMYSCRSRFWRIPLTTSR